MSKIAADALVEERLRAGLAHSLYLFSFPFDMSMYFSFFTRYT